MHFFAIFSQRWDKITKENRHEKIVKEQGRSIMAKSDLTKAT